MQVFLRYDVPVFLQSAGLLTSVHQIPHGRLVKPTSCRNSRLNAAIGLHRKEGRHKVGLLSVSSRDFGTDQRLVHRVIGEVMVDTVCHDVYIILCQ